MSNFTPSTVLPLFFCGFIVVAADFGCTRGEPNRELILATTTSTYDSGLLEKLVPAFERESGLEVKVVAVGSGQAIAMGRLGEADVLLVHSPAAETAFMKTGCGAGRQPVMHNFFVVLGPPSDQAKIRGSKAVTQAFSSLAANKVSFVSRGDDSGTHAREKLLWAKSGVRPSGNWYIESGQGMAATLRMASEKRAYTLSDIGTFLSLRSTLDLVPVVEEDPLLENPYHVITVAQKCGKRVRVDAARRFATYITSRPAQKIIEAFGRGRHSSALFVPDALEQSHP